jgi:hypothetical protein
MSAASRVAAKLRINRRITEAFIAEAPIVVELIPVTRTRTLSGGYLEVDLEPRDPQTFCLVENNGQFRTGVQRTLVGEARVEEYMLLGTFDAEMAKGDHWTDATTGREWKIDDVLSENGYERRGVVIERGK